MSDGYRDIPVHKDCCLVHSLVNMEYIFISSELVPFFQQDRQFQVFVLNYPIWDLLNISQFHGRYIHTCLFFASMDSLKSTFLRHINIIVWYSRKIQAIFGQISTLDILPFDPKLIVAIIWSPPLYMSLVPSQGRAQCQNRTNIKTDWWNKSTGRLCGELKWICWYHS